MASQQVVSLHFAVRPVVLFKYGGQLLLVFAILTGVILLFALLVGEYRLAVNFGTVVAGTGMAGYFLQRLKAPRNLQDNESLVLSAAIFVLAPLLLAFPLQQSGLPFADALFEAVSGITTTGLTTLAEVENRPKTFYFSRAWLQWIGGLGIVVLSVALLLPRTATLHLFEVRDRDDLVTGTKSYARIVLKIYLLLTGAGIAALLLLGIDWLDAVTHVLAGISTGGFSPHDNSLAGLTAWPARTTVMVICCLGAVSLGLYYHALQKGWHTFAANAEVRGLCVAGGATALLTILFLVLLDGFSPPEALRHGLLLAFSAQTTAGFSTVTVADLAPGTKLLLMLAMLTGGNLGSTAGGIKIIRLLIVFKLLRLAILHSGMASGLEIFAFLVLLYPPTWIGKKRGETS